MKSEQMDLVDYVARKFHHLYFERFTQFSLMSQVPEWETMPEHQEALRATLFELEDEGYITIHLGGNS